MATQRPAHAWKQPRFGRDRVRGDGCGRYWRTSGWPVQLMRVANPGSRHTGTGVTDLRKKGERGWSGVLWPLTVVGQDFQETFSLDYRRGADVLIAIDLHCNLIL